MNKYQQEQEEFQRIHDIKAGDMVRVVEAFNKYSMVSPAQTTWNCTTGFEYGVMNKYVGKCFPVLKFSDVHGFYLRSDDTSVGYYFPFFLIEKVVDEVKEKTLAEKLNENAEEIKSLKEKLVHAEKVSIELANEAEFKKEEDFNNLCNSFADVAKKYRDFFEHGHDNSFMVRTHGKYKGKGLYLDGDYRIVQDEYGSRVLIRADDEQN